MTPEETERLKALCKMIEVEKDHNKFSELLIELNELIVEKEKRITLHLPKTPPRA